AMSLNNHASLLADVGQWAEAIPVSEEALRLCRELVELNREAYLPDYVKCLAARGYVWIENSRFAAAVTPLVEALPASRELPEHVAQDIVGWVTHLLRLAYAKDATAVADEFRLVTGQDVPAWMKEPPSATAG
ncbi:tetratricopeptide repeat protein, partial [Microbispora sp. NPDC004025]